MKKLFFSMILCGLVTLSFAQEEKQASEQPVSKDVAAAIRLANNLARYGYDNFITGMCW